MRKTVIINNKKNHNNINLIKILILCTIIFIIRLNIFDSINNILFDIIDFVPVLFPYLLFSEHIGTNQGSGSTNSNFDVEATRAILDRTPVNKSKTPGPWKLSELNPNITEEIRVKIPNTLDDFTPISRWNAEVEIAKYEPHHIPKYPQSPYLQLRNNITERPQKGQMEPRNAMTSLRYFIRNMSDLDKDPAKKEFYNKIKLMSKENLELETNDTVPKFTLVAGKICLWTDHYSVKLDGTIVEKEK